MTRLKEKIMMSKKKYLGENRYNIQETENFTKKFKFILSKF